MSKITAMALPLALGVVFGFALEKGQVFIPAVIAGQMMLSRWVMMKMFLAAASTSMLVHVALAAVLPERMREERGKWHKKSRGLASVAVGTALLGCGMAIAGSCPGTVFVQAGAGVGGFWWVLLGGLAGALVYIAAYNTIDSSGLLSLGRVDAVFLEELAGVSFIALGSGVAVLLFATIALIESLAPWEGELPYSPAGSTDSFGPLSLRAWPPYVAGAAFGLVQIPLLLLLRTTAGSSTAFVTVPSCALASVSPSTVSAHPYMQKVSAKTWQVVYVGGAVLGAFLSSHLSGSFMSAAHTLPAPVLVLGGFLLVFGARLADGCTSGHGVSGFSQLSVASALAVPCMFGAGIACALALDACGFYNY
eukprot:TRINITY_DN1392_c0_g1_i1.p1 TRINITY_DN1392_c0_g1~~TRINITY_DN1392_c0_g1_i1.p1  ORF type:complete len:402 (+),score=109.98 TRINITY_DN1392_c0_g1_i1:117-1208(+)